MAEEVAGGQDMNESGKKILVGEREGEWFKRWEGTIRRSVMGRKIEQRAMSEPDEPVTNWPATMLDGFH